MTIWIDHGHTKDNLTKVGSQLTWYALSDDTIRSAISIAYYIAQLFIDNALSATCHDFKTCIVKWFYFIILVIKPYLYGTV